MTQNIYSGPDTLSGSKAENGENLSSSEIRADIDQTRASVGEKIDQLQARLDPNKLKAQAQETVQEMITDTASSMTDYVRTHKDEMVNSLADAARRNPLPTALIGLGVGWLILESMGGNKRDDNRHYDSRRDSYSDAPRYNPRYEDRYEPPYDARFDPRLDEQRWQEAWGSPDIYARSRFEGSTGRSYVSQGRGSSANEGYYSPEYNDAYQGAPDYGRSGYPGYEGRYANGGYANGRQDQYGNGQQSGNPISKAADSVKDVASDVKSKVSDVAGDVKDKVSDAAGDVKDKISDAANAVKDSVSNVTDQIGDKMSDMRDQMGDMGERGQRTMNRAGAQMSDWQERARYESYQARHMAQRYARRGGSQIKHNLEDNPLIYGAVALAAGAALAMLLPRSRAENRAFGEMRDQVMTRGQEFLETAKSHAGNVIEEVRPELEEKARQIVSDATQAGKEAVKSAADELKPVVDKAVAKGKEEARSVAQETGVDPSKLTLATSSTEKSGPGKSGADKPLIINRDTMKGQWKQVQGEVKKQWGQLTDDDLLQAEGNYDKLVGSIQQRYGYTRERVEREVSAFFDSHKG